MVKDSPCDLRLVRFPDQKLFKKKEPLARINKKESRKNQKLE